MLYPIELTPPAEDAYLRMYSNAQPYITAGQTTHPSVVALNTVDKVLDTVIAKNPCNPDLALAGVCSVIYRAPAGTLSICYIVNPCKPAVIVLTISPNQPEMRRWLISAIENGTVDQLLETLEIEKPGSRFELSSRLLH